MAKAEVQLTPSLIYVNYQETFMSEALISRLVEFAESGNQQKITVAGQTHQGWIMEITEEALMISTGYADKAGKDVWIQFSDLDQATLSYWDNQNDQWSEFKL